MATGIHVSLTPRLQASPGIHTSVANHLHEEADFFPARLNISTIVYSDIKCRENSLSNKRNSFFFSSEQCHSPRPARSFIFCRATDRTRESIVSDPESISGQSPSDGVKVENMGSNSRKVTAKIQVSTPLQEVWSVLTDYENLGSFIPSLAVNELLEKRPSGALLLQIGQQSIGLGLKFKAKAVVEVEENPTIQSNDLLSRSIEFNMVEGDFKLFRGIWGMEEEIRATGDENCGITTLSYSVQVTPQAWLPVALVERRIANEICTNLTCVMEEALRRYTCKNMDRESANVAFN